MPWALVVAVAAYILADKSGFLGDAGDLGEEPEVWIPSDPLAVAISHVAASEGRREAGVSLPAAARGGGAESGVRAAHNQRLLSTAATGTSSSLSSSASSSSSHGDHDGHQHDAMLFLFTVFVLGTLITHVTTLPFFHGLQQTVVLFVAGVLFSLVQEGLKVGGSPLHEQLGVYGRSYNMWMDIDPHLILFTMLPALLTGDAMTLDTSVARRVAKQCIYLASVGLLINALLTAVFLQWYLPYNWSFLLSMTTGAILCATDPVAVVALLKELGASPTLTVQIQGESLLNDGTAIVLYTIAYNMLQGESYDAADILIFLMKKAVCAWGLGMVIGWVFCGWIKKARNKLDSHSTMIQVSLTLCCAYWSFIMAEGVFHISGVLATVAAALVLAHRMWPVVVCKESMHTTWHMLEYLGNTLVFFLAGALTGKSMVHIHFDDYLHLLVIYLMLTVIRLVMLLISRPVLRHLDEDRTPVSLGEVIVMTWGGLRGAVGLALAIQVTVDRAGGKISEEDANRVLFYCGGVAFWTIVLNASTCPYVVKALGITRMPRSKRRMLMLIHRRLLEISREKDHPETVTKAIQDMLYDMEVHIDRDGIARPKSMLTEVAVQPVQVRTASPNGANRPQSPKAPTADDDRREKTAYSIGTDSQSLSSSEISSLDLNGQASGSVGLGPHFLAMRTTLVANGRDFVMKLLGGDENYDIESNADLEKSHAKHKKQYKRIKSDHLRLLGHLPNTTPYLDQEQAMFSIIQQGSLDRPLMRAMSEAFLSLVRSAYFKQMEEGDLVPGTTEAEVLMGSITMALNHPHGDLQDFDYIAPFFRRIFGHKDAQAMMFGRGSSDALIYGGIAATLDRAPCCRDCRASVHWLVRSNRFQITIFVAVLADAVNVLLAEEYNLNDEDVGWLIATGCFTAIFLVECLLKLWDMWWRYFLDSWNLFDFFLIIVNIAGLTFQMMAASKATTSEDTAFGAQTQIVRMSRVFRVMRLIRVFRLLQFWQMMMSAMEDEESMWIRQHMEKITILTCFVRAHLHGQQELVQYFGTHGKVDTAEVARCILQSQVMVFRAVSMAVDVELELDPLMLKEVNQVRMSQHVVEELEKFVMDAHGCGVVTTREAESILLPLHDHMKVCMKQIRLTTHGMKRRTTNGSWTSCNSKRSLLGRRLAKKSLRSVRSVASRVNVQPEDDDEKEASKTLEEDQLPQEAAPHHVESRSTLQTAQQEESAVSTSLIMGLQYSGDGSSKADFSPPGAVMISDSASAVGDESARDPPPPANTPPGTLAISSAVRAALPPQ